MIPEAAARQVIDELLVAAGWAIQDYKAFNPSAARGIALREVPLDSGRCDYLLLVDRVPLGVIEAKKQGTTLSTVSDQSAHYGENLPDFLAALLPGTKKIPFAYESTGVETLFRDERDPRPRSRRVFAFHQPATLAACLAEPDTLRARLATLPTAHPLPATNLRACQIEAITKLEASFAADRPRALIQMAILPINMRRNSHHSLTQSLKHDAFNAYAQRGSRTWQNGQKIQKRAVAFPHCEMLFRKT